MQGGKGAADLRSSGGYIAAVGFFLFMWDGHGVRGHGQWDGRVHSPSFQPWDLKGRHTMRQSDPVPVQYSGEQSASEVSTSGPADGVFARAERATLSGASWSVSGVVSGVEGGGR